MDDDSRKRHRLRRDDGDREKERKEHRRSERDRTPEERHRRSDRDRSPEERRSRSEKDRSSEDRHDRDRRKERERDKEWEKEREKAKEKEKAREREREERDRERRREKERAREREEREREKEREEKERRRAREERERRRADKDDEERDHEWKRRRREELRDRSASQRVREGSEEAGRRDEVDAEKEREKAREEDQRKLDEDMEKRRRRVQEWQEMKKRQFQEELEKSGGGNTEEQLEPGKKWTLEGESDDEEVAKEEDAGAAAADVMDGDAMVADKEDGGNAAPKEEEIDPLDAFMNALEQREDTREVDAGVSLQAENGKKHSLSKEGVANGSMQKGKKVAMMGRIIPGEESASDYSDEEDEGVAPDDEDDDGFIKRVKKSKVEKLSIVDHSKIQYPPFRKNFYIEVKEILKMTSEEVSAYRIQLELKIHGKDVPKPIKTWSQTGLTSKILDMIKKLNFEKPMPIQAQALTIIMSGRDCIGIAKTGSGKTLAFVLPMLRHIKDQPPVVPGDGPIGLIMAPTRELVQQIHSDIKKFAKIVGLNCIPVYGGSGVAQQISELKRGAEIVVCTPGRMIDILCTSSGKISNLRRVTYLVMDEADRMFDMGFEPQITRIIQNTRPDRQTVLFSATFPRQVEILARKVLNKPVEIQVGGRSVVNKDIMQLVEVRPESERFLRLLELLGEWYGKGKVLVFVHSQEKCDSLFRDLLKHGYPCLSLHGAKDQTDRESTISDFKSNVCNLLIATSIAARGLDVKELELVVNFDVPNHYEDYVHRVGRTGRAGRKGCAITFISEDDARYAPDLVKALELSEQAVPQDLKALAVGFMTKVNQGTEQAHGTGYGGSGFKFNEEEEDARKAAKKAQAREHGFEEVFSDSDSDDEVVQKLGDVSQVPVLSKVPSILPNGGLAGLAIPGSAGLSSALPAGDATAQALAAALNLRHNLAKIQADAMPEHYHAELEINDFPQNARWKVTHKETLGPISEWTGAAITTRGTYCPPGKVAPQERKLYLYIEGPTESSVKKAKTMLKQVLEDCTQLALNLPGNAQPGKYSVL